MNSQEVSREHLVCFGGRLQQHGLTGLELLDVSYSSVGPRDSIFDDPLPSSLAAAALQYCSNLAHLIVEDSRWDSDSPRRFVLLTVAEALRLRDVNGKARPLERLHLQYEEEFTSPERLPDILLSKSCGSLVELRLEAAWYFGDGIEEAVATYLRATGAPFLRRLLNHGGESSESTEIALNLRKGSVPQLEELTFNYVMESNSMPILADAVTQNGYFAGLRDLNLVGGSDKLDVSPLFRAIANGHKCSVLKSLDVSYACGLSMMALRDAFAAGAFPLLTSLTTPLFGPGEIDELILLIQMLVARAAPMEQFHLNGDDLPHAAFQVLADTLSTPAFASLESLAVPSASSVAFDPLLTALRVGAGQHLTDLTFGKHYGSLSEESILQLYEALTTEDICPKLESVNFLGEGETASLVETFLKERRDKSLQEA